MTGICRPVSKEAVRSPSAAARPPSPQGGGSGSIGRGLNSMSAAHLPPKSATTKIRCLRASLREPAQYWASMSRQHTSGVPPRTIPAFPHFPEGGIGTSVSEKADRTALKSMPYDKKHLDYSVVSFDFRCLACLNSCCLKPTNRSQWGALRKFLKSEARGQKNSIKQ